MSNGFIDTNKGFDLIDVQAQQASADALYITDIPSTGTEITGLQSGKTEAIAIANSATLNAALQADVAKDMIIPDSSSAVDGVWYTHETVWLGSDTTLTFVGKIHQLVNGLGVSEERHVVRSDSPNIIINNPRISQRGRTTKISSHGTHSCLAIYGTNNPGNIQVNGGVLEYGAHNCFQGGRPNTTFTGTTFKHSGEHLIYAQGSKRDSYNDPDVRASGLTFDNCIMDSPGHGEEYTEIEANHIQLRQFIDVTISNCEIKGVRKTAWNQYAILCTGIKGLTVTDTTISDYTNGMIYGGNLYNYDSSDFVLTNIVARPASGNKRVAKNLSREQDPDATGTEVYEMIFNNLTVDSPLGVRGLGGANFYNSTFKLTGYFFLIDDDAPVLFDDCVWDSSGATYSSAMSVESGSSATFTGTSTRIEPTAGQAYNWSPIPSNP